MIIIPQYVYAELKYTPFPKTYTNLSFQDRIKNKIEGYKPFMDKNVYAELDIVPGEEIYTDSMMAQIEYNETNNTNDFALQSDDAPDDDEITTVDLEYDKTDNVAVDDEITTIHIAGLSTIGGGVVLENNYARGNSCYPPDTDAHFPNKILTTGRYEKQVPAFEKAMITIFRKEGTCGKIPGDPCGYTCYGIGSSPKCAGVVIHTRSAAEDWYYNNIWQKYSFNILPDVISGDFFLATMASGPKTAFNQMRDFLGLQRSQYYRVDQEMINAVYNYSGDIHNDWLDKRDVFLQNVSKKRYQGRLNNGYKNAIELKRKNGCHTRPKQPLYRQ